MEGRKAIPKSVREAVKQKFNYRCAYCGCKPKRLQIDHIVPYCFPHVLDNEILRKEYVPEFLYHLRSGDINSKDNLFPACQACNNFKGANHLEDFRRALSLQPERAEKNINYKMAKRFGLIEETGKEVIFYFETAGN
jgi:5-methylcytosine-specific restriction endonuclease McrA